MVVFELHEHFTLAAIYRVNNPGYFSNFNEWPSLSRLVSR
jgi:hypothetical protein